MLLMFKIQFFSIFWKMKRLYLPLLLLPFSIISRSSRPEVFCKKGVLRNVTKFTGKHLCQSLFFNKVAGLGCNFIEKETLAQMLSCEVCVLFKNTYFYRTTLVAVSARYIRGNVYFGIIAFSCLSSRKPCLIFLLICFAREIKAFIGVPWEMRLISGT